MGLKFPKMFKRHVWKVTLHALPSLPLESLTTVAVPLRCVARKAFYIHFGLLSCVPKSSSACAPRPRAVRAQLRI